LSELCWDAFTAASGLEEAGMLLDAGVASWAGRELFDALSVSLISDVRFAGVTVTGIGPDLFWKKPAILCCFDPNFCVLELAVFFAFGSPISLPSIPLAMLLVHTYMLH